jgi:hypothetical protein
MKGADYGASWLPGKPCATHPAADASAWQSGCPPEPNEPQVVSICEIDPVCAPQLMISNETFVPNL